MARLMDSLILDSFSPFALAKISNVRASRSNVFEKKAQNQQTKTEPLKMFHVPVQQITQSIQTGKFFIIYIAYICRSDFCFLYTTSSFKYQFYSQIVKICIKKIMKKHTTKRRNWFMVHIIP